MEFEFIYAYSGRLAQNMSIDALCFQFCRRWCFCFVSSLIQGLDLVKFGAYLFRGF